MQIGSGIRNLFDPGSWMEKNRIRNTIKKITCLPDL
jgi:hypothetical protein